MNSAQDISSEKRTKIAYWSGCWNTPQWKPLRTINYPKKKAQWVLLRLFSQENLSSHRDCLWLSELKTCSSLARLSHCHFVLHSLKKRKNTLKSLLLFVKQPLLQSNELMQQCVLSSEESLEQQFGELCLFGWVKHLDGCLTMIFQLPAQITLSLFTKAHKKTRFIFLSGCTKGRVEHWGCSAERRQAE